MAQAFLLDATIPRYHDAIFSPSRFAVGDNIEAGDVADLVFASDVGPSKSALVEQVVVAIQLEQAEARVAVVATIDRNGESIRSTGLTPSLAQRTYSENYRLRPRDIWRHKSRHALFRTC